ncbi:hypothetical protein QBC38DRAFT_471740 [Podospora fimiseda]|uniref:Tetratricopeptide SHNi-TPR domain-containing protein n=1 Tax=Podospora fimiseda TaxID=252190 RepID=A0AAN7BU83_9PEZI|nr:hypothetical protein QBC38DRAFT_471740 [Podospora fimiseda]
METPAASTGTATPLELDPEQAAHSLKVSLADLSAKATALYAHKNFEDAAELFARAAEMQAEMNGEMSPENAEILFLYGRALFRVGQSKSDVLGGKAPEKKQAKPKASNGSNSSKKNGVEKAEAKVEKAVSSAAAETVTKKEETSTETKKPLFHFEGDENFVDSEEEEEDEEEGEGEDEEEDDDLGTAFEILDLARVLLEKKLESAQAEDEAKQGKGKEADTGENGASPKVRHIKERLGDTHDLLAEISLENERYPNAITDSRASLKYKQELYPFESEIIAEAHFKLSLALEFASVTKSSEDDAQANNNTEVDQSLRDEAAAELAKAIESTKQKLQSQEVELAAVHNPEDNDLSRQEIVNIKEILAEMEQRLVELRKPPLDINQALGLPSRGEEPPSIAKPVSEEIKKNANDLTGLVRKKRKAEDELLPTTAKEDSSIKRAKSEDTATTTTGAEKVVPKNTTN